MMKSLRFVRPAYAVAAGRIVDKCENHNISKNSKRSYVNYEYSGAGGTGCFCGAY